MVFMTTHEIDAVLKAKTEKKQALEKNLKQADETLGQLKQQCESLKSSMETLKARFLPQWKALKMRYRQRSIHSQKRRKTGKKLIPNSFHSCKATGVFMRLFRDSRKKWQQQNRNMCGCGHFLIQQGHT